MHILLYWLPKSASNCIIMHILYANMVLVAKKRTAKISYSNALEWNSNLVECKVNKFSTSC
jgi:hypothetical protein